MLRVLLVVFLCAGSSVQKAPTVCVRHIESPGYPQVARLAHISGAVEVKVLISPDGKVTSATAVSGPPVLGQYAAENLKNWVFDEGDERRLDIVFRFRLERPAVDYAPPPRVSFDLPNSVEITSKYATPTN